MRLSSIPAGVLDAVRQRGHSDEAIKRMSPEQLFSEACNWEGLVNWGPRLYRTVLELREKDELEKLTGAYALPFGIHIRVTPEGGGEIISELSQIVEPDLEPEGESEARGFVHGVESLLLAMACAGVNLNQPEITEALQVAVEKAENEYCY